MLRDKERNRQEKRWEVQDQKSWPNKLVNKEKKSESDKNEHEYAKIWKENTGTNRHQNGKEEIRK